MFGNGNKEINHTEQTIQDEKQNSANRDSITEFSNTSYGVVGAERVDEENSCTLRRHIWMLLLTLLEQLV